MPWVGQNFQRTDGTRTGATVWDQARTAGVKIVSNGHDTHDEDIAQGLTLAHRKDGGNTATGNIPMGGFRHTNVGAATTRTEYTRADDVQDGKLIYGTVGGTADAITVTLTPPPANYLDGFTISFRATATNTGAVTVDVNGLGAKAVEKMRTALVAADITNGDSVYMIYDSGGGGGAGAFAMITPQRSPILTDGSIAPEKISSFPLPAGHKSGGTLSRNLTDPGNDIDITAFSWRSADNAADLIAAAAIGKQLDVTWAAGGTPATPTGGRASSQPLADGAWAVIAGLVSGTTEVGFDTDPGGANLITDHSFTNTRRLGWILRNSGAIRAFTQNGNLFDLATRVLYTAGTNVPTADTLIDTLLPPNVLGRFHANYANGSDSGVVFTATHQNAINPSVTNGDLVSRPQGTVSSIKFEVWTDASRQIRWRGSDGTVTRIYFEGEGWIDERDV